MGGSATNWHSHRLRMCFCNTLSDGLTTKEDDDDDDEEEDNAKIEEDDEALSSFRVVSFNESCF